MAASEGGHPLPRRICLQHLREDVQAEEDPPAARALSLWGKTLFVLGVLKDICTEEEPPPPREVPHGGEAAHLHAVQQKLPPARQSESTPEVSHWRQAFQLHHVWKDVQDHEESGETPVRILCSFIQDDCWLVAVEGVAGCGG